MKKTLFLTILILILQSCGGGIPQSEYDKVVQENIALKAEVEDLKFGADKLFKDAKSFFSNQKYKEAKSKLSILIEKHPTSSEAIEAKKLIKDSDKEIHKEKLLAEKKAKEEEAANKRRLAKATSKLNKRYDDINEITWYEDKSSGGYKSRIYAYIGKNENSNPWLRFYIRYYADDWLFIKNYKFKIDDETVTIKEREYGEIKTNNSGGSIWETLDRKVDKETFNLLVAISNSKSAKIRHNGKDYYKDRTISSSEKRAIKKVLDAYEALGGDMNFK